MVRKPIVAGQFYENDFQKLEEQIRSCFFSEYGPGDLPIERREGKLIGAISPHAGYPFSGHCAAWVYKRIAETTLPDLFIFLGPSHAGHETAISGQDWETPFGALKVDTEFGKLLSQETGAPIDDTCHADEHSIEVQLPLLQFVNKDRMEKLRILPIVVSHDMDYRKFADSLRKVIKLTRKKVCIIASSDFTHYGPNYGFVPFVYNIKENLYDLDGKALEMIKTLDAGKFLSYVDKTGATICGRMPIALLMETIGVDTEQVHVLRYYTSGDIMDDYENAVGYAGVIFTE